jgi:tRNA(Ile)-lysidine synthase
MLQKIKDNLSAIPNLNKVNFLLAVSGGMDSMMLLYAFKELRLNFGVAHCNFQLRGEESNLDETLVTNSCSKIPFHVKIIDIKKYQETNNASTQMAARETRYNWFNELANDNQYDYIVTAHHLNDQIETFFINLSRGTGIEGLAGINPFNGRIFRPMLNVSRSEIECFVGAQKIKYREDKSNSSLKYKRNKIRHQLIPLFKELNPSFEETMLNNMKILESTNHIYQKKIDSVLSSGIIKTKETNFYIDIAKLKSTSKPQQFLFEFIRRYNFNATQSGLIFSTINTSYTPGKIFESLSHKLIIDRVYLIITPNKEQEKEIIKIKKKDKNVTYPISLSFDTLPNDDIKINPDTNLAYLDFDKISFPLSLRRWQQGDFFYPLGMTKKKKLSDFFIDNKLSILEKEATYILTSNDEIIWVIGKRVSNNHKITSDTKNILIVTLKE